MSSRRCVLYARISVSKEESVSVDRQLDAGRRLAELRGWEVAGEFVDDGVSATANRPEDRAGWKALLRSGPFDAVVIWKVDRLARRVLDFLHVDETLQARGAGLVAVEDPIDMTTPMGKAFATILAVFGEMEAAAIAARVKAARAYIVADGRWPGGGVPYGYQSTPNPDGPGRVLAVDPERMRWLRKIIRRAQRGHTVNRIATWLTRKGAPLPAGRTRTSGNRAWNRQTVDGILRNPSIAGARPHNPGRKKSAKRADPYAVLRDDAGDPVVDADLAVITWADFEELQEQLTQRVGTSPQAKPMADRIRTSALLSKAAICDDCDVYLCRGTNQKRPVLYCPTCRQVIGRTRLDPWLASRLLAERADEPYGRTTVRIAWAGAEGDDHERRRILLSQVDTFRIRRGVVGRAFDAERVLLTWCPSAQEVAA